MSVAGIKPQTWPKSRSCGDKRLDYSSSLLMAYRGIERAIYDLKLAAEFAPQEQPIRALEQALDDVMVAYLSTGINDRARVNPGEPDPRD